MEDISQSSNESTTNSSEDNNPLIFVNQPRDPEVSEVDEEQEGMTDEPILEIRYEPMASKPVGTGFHTFTLDDDKPTGVIAFINIGAASSLINFVVLPEDQWVLHFKDFNTASNGIVTTTIITKHPVTIEFFLGLKYRTKLIGSDVPGKDLIVGFDIYRQLRDQLQIKANGIAFKKQFKLYFEVPRPFQITNDEQIKEIEQNLIAHSCVEFHKDFMKKGKSPLWNNQEFFIKIPFKKNKKLIRQKPVNQA
uniref:Uncharacterized protein LOC104211989 n=1 Tax=Nicotiana sylvestris TaxID=4096 RepID=A0A1U7UTT1_NICSY|nr:PREDICTED: uncharacterized protein LOC104211989 [Nicotiana sylvestris]